MFVQLHTILLKTGIPLLLATCAGMLNLGAQAPVLSSPGGTLRVEIAGTAEDEGNPEGMDGRLYYQIRRGTETVVEWSPLGLVLEREGGSLMDFHSAIEIGRIERESGEDSFALPHGKARAATAPFNQMTLEVKNPAGQRMELVFRAFVDGIAFRYELQGSGQATLIEEHTAFKVPEGTTGYLQRKDFPGLYAPNYQDPIVKAPAGTLSSGNGYVLPGLFSMDGTGTWLLFHESGLTAEYFGAHLGDPSPGGLYPVSLPHPGEGNGIGSVVPTATLPFSTPWRILAIGGLETVAETHLVNHLAEPFDAERFGDYAWVHPGKSAWSWWSQDTGTSGLQYEYIDFAHEFGWEYVLIDGRWDHWPNPEMEIRNLVAYATERSVRILLWYNSGGPHNSVLDGTPRNRMLDPAIRQAELDRIVEWGIAGIKVDFFFSDKQDRIQQYIGIMEDALERGLLTNFHGSTVPRGWSRTYPNLMTMEAVTGAENYKWRGEPWAQQNVRYTFTRNVVGPMDYTPLTFDSALSWVGITYAHQLALAVTFESGIQHFADRADSSTQHGFRKLFAEEPEVAAFLTEVPVAWDESRLLDGHPDTHAVWARRRGADWYVAGINGLNSSLSTTLHLEDLVDRPVTVSSFVRGTADNDLAFSQSIYQPADSIPFTMAPRDGFTLRITPVPLTYADWIARLTDLPEQRDPQADIDGDGLANLLEFLFDHDPRVPDFKRGHLPAIVLENDKYYLRFKLRSAIITEGLAIESAGSPDFSDAEGMDLSTTVTDDSGWHWLPIEPGQHAFFRIIARSGGVVGVAEDVFSP